MRQLRGSLNTEIYDFTKLITQNFYDILNHSSKIAKLPFFKREMLNKIFLNLFLFSMNLFQPRLNFNNDIIFLISAFESI